MLWEGGFLFFFFVFCFVFLPVFFHRDFRGARAIFLCMSAREGTGQSSTASICWVRNKLDTVSRHVEFLAHGSLSLFFVKRFPTAPSASSTSVRHYRDGRRRISLSVFSPSGLSRFPATVTAFHTKYFLDSNTSLFLSFSRSESVPGRAWNA